MSDDCELCWDTPHGEWRYGNRLCLRRHVRAGARGAGEDAEVGGRRGPRGSVPCDTVDVIRSVNGWGAFYSVGYPSRVFRKVNHYVLKRMARFLNRKSQRYYRLKFADTYYGEMAHYGLYRLAWADMRRTRG